MICSGGSCRSTSLLSTVPMFCRRLKCLVHAVRHPRNTECMPKDEADLARGAFAVGQVPFAKLRSQLPPGCCCHPPQAIELSWSMLCPAQKQLTWLLTWQVKCSPDPVPLLTRNLAIVGTTGRHLHTTALLGPRFVVSRERLTLL